MYDKNFKKINVGDTIYFSCGGWHYEAHVYNVTKDRIYHYQTSKGNGEGQRRDSNRIECDRYVMIMNGI
jgi:hypothetical protein